jgi:hypothetical protein
LLLKAKQYAQEALAPLLSWGIVSRLVIDALYATRRSFAATIHLKISVAGPGVASSFTLEGSQQPNAEWLWREYQPARAVSTTGRLYAKVTR